MKYFISSFLLLFCIYYAKSDLSNFDVERVKLNEDDNNCLNIQRLKSASPDELKEYVDSFIGHLKPFEYLFNGYFKYFTEMYNEYRKNGENETKDYNISSDLKSILYTLIDYIKINELRQSGNIIIDSELIKKTLEFFDEQIRNKKYKVDDLFKVSVEQEGNEVHFVLILDKINEEFKLPGFNLDNIKNVLENDKFQIISEILSKTKGQYNFSSILDIVNDIKGENHSIVHVLDEILNQYHKYFQTYLESDEDLKTTRELFRQLLNFISVKTNSQISPLGRIIYDINNNNNIITLLSKLCPTEIIKFILSLEDVIDNESAFDPMITATSIVSSLTNQVNSGSIQMLIEEVKNLAGAIKKVFKGVLNVLNNNKEYRDLMKAFVAQKERELFKNFVSLHKKTIKKNFAHLSKNLAITKYLDSEDKLQNVYDAITTDKFDIKNLLERINSSKILETFNLQNYIQSETNLTTLFHDIYITIMNDKTMQPIIIKLKNWRLVEAYKMIYDRRVMEAAKQIWAKYFNVEINEVFQMIMNHITDDGKKNQLEDDITLFDEAPNDNDLDFDNIF